MRNDRSASFDYARENRRASFRMLRYAGVASGWRRQVTEGPPAGLIRRRSVALRIHPRAGVRGGEIQPKRIHYRPRMSLAVF
jgi:hypothetical protein